MPRQSDIRSDILGLLAKARSVMSTELLGTRPASQRLGGEPEWHPFEHKHCRIGEEIRRLMQQAPPLQADRELQGHFLAIATDRAGSR